MTSSNASTRWKRFVPYLVPIAFVLMSRFIVTQLDASYEIKAASAEVMETKQALADKYGSVKLEGGELSYEKSP